LKYILLPDLTVASTLSYTFAAIHLLSFPPGFLILNTKPRRGQNRPSIDQTTHAA